MADVEWLWLGLMLAGAAVIFAVVRRQRRSGVSARALGVTALVAVPTFVFGLMMFAYGQFVYAYDDEVIAHRFGKQSTLSLILREGGRFVVEDDSRRACAVGTHLSKPSWSFDAHCGDVLIKGPRGWVIFYVAALIAVILGSMVYGVRRMKESSRKV